ncbi:MAG: hypothetical protein QM733_23410 [Ilumatobacteraceae bacterium]
MSIPTDGERVGQPIDDAGDVAQRVVADVPTGDGAVEPAHRARRVLQR